ncbi:MULTISPECIES: phage holin family protein [Vagococcus]|uniref:Phage holin n=1 Tax=Vagococcus fluvialis bH819 TaxID=1255619 RepID=A0A1X6WRT0_9ENTE|nr:MULTISPECIES: phage holin family protein [Vagococcus]SLM87063.1 Phage holin [Vagococcus fluvialis bH819]HCM90591.1 holin [Vagococcus sp.]
MEKPIFDNNMDLNDIYLNPYIYLLIIVIIVDIFTGLAKAIFSRNYPDLDSTIGLRGLIKHVVVLILVIVFNAYCVMFQLSAYSDLFILFYIGNYGLSIIENLGALGIPIPNFIKKHINKLK